MTRSLIDEHAGWHRIEPDGERRGNRRRHDPQPAAPSWPGGGTRTPGRRVTARYVYLLTPTGPRARVRLDGARKYPGRAAYTRETGTVRFDLIVARARGLQEAHARRTDPLN